MSLKRKIIALLIVLCLILSSGCSGRGGEKPYSDMMIGCVNAIQERGHSHKIIVDLSVNGEINDGMTARYVVVARISPDSLSVGLQTEKNQLVSTYPNFIIGQGETLLLDLDRLYLFMEDNGIERLVSDTEYLRSKYLRLDNGQDSTRFSDAFSGYVKAWTILHDNAVAEIKNESGEGYEYVIPAENMKTCFEQIDENRDLVYDEADKLLKTLFGDELNDLIEAYEEKIGEKILVENYEEMFKAVAGLFEAKVNTDMYDEIREKFAADSSDSCDGVSYSIALNSKGKTLLSLNISVGHADASPALPSVEAADVIELDNLNAKLKSEMKDMLNDNYECADVWDAYKLTETSLTLIRYGEAADVAYQYIFSDGKMIEYMETYKTKDIDMHEILRHDAMERGMSVNTNSPGGIYSDGYGVLEMYTKNLYDALPSYLSYSHPGELLDYFIAIGIVREGSDEK